MSLDSLLGTSLDKVEPNRKTVAQLLAAAERNLTDSQLPALSAENRFDAAYKAIMQLAMLALHANGYRTLTSRPGHHRTSIQTLPQTIGLSTEQMIVLDGLRKQRNLSDYVGDPVPESAIRECVSRASALLVHLKGWLESNTPHLI
jgi:hypothetical protein